MRAGLWVLRRGLLGDAMKEHGPTVGQGGGLTVEMVVLTPLLVLVIMMMVAFGRLERAAGEVTDATRAAAEAGVVWTTPAQATDAAQQTAAEALDGDGVTCSPFATSLDTSHWGPGGSVTATVTCTVSFSAVVFPGIPGSLMLTRHVSAPIETYRSFG